MGIISVYKHLCGAVVASARTTEKSITLLEKIVDTAHHKVDKWSDEEVAKLKSLDEFKG